MLTIFANFRINDEERLQRMKDSFLSFYKIDAEWVINIRGQFKSEAKIYLEESINKKCHIEHYETNEGWLKDTLHLQKHINTEFILVWVEDHVCQIDHSQLSLIVSEMKKNSIDYLNYTWFFKEYIDKWYSDIHKSHSDNLLHFNLDLVNYNKILKTDRGYNYLISLPSIFSRDLFIKNLNSNRPFLRRWPKETPFDFEKKHKDKYMLPFRMAIPKYEIFACIDDDNGCNGYSLQSRKIYKSREIRVVGVSHKFQYIPLFIKQIIKRLMYHFIY